MCDEKHYLFSSVQQKHKKEKTTYKLRIFGNNLAIFDNGRKRNMRTNLNQSVCIKENHCEHLSESFWGAFQVKPLSMLLNNIKCLPNDEIS